MRTRHAEQGFTLIELMVVVVASAIVTAGAFALHQTFNRQNIRLQKVAEVQQTLRVARQYIERKLRYGGSGLLEGKPITMPMRADGTTCTDRPLNGIIFHNNNSQNATLVDSVTDDQDTDPDWFEYAGIDPNASGVTVTGLPGNTNGQSENIQVSDNSSFGNCDNVFTIFKGGVSCTYVVQRSTGNDMININAQGCSHTTTGCLGSAGSGFSHKLDDCTCNPDVNPDYPETGRNSNGDCEKYVAGAEVKSVGPGLGAVRLFARAEGPLNFPVAMLASGRLDYSIGNYDWSKGPLTDLIEDLQFEVMLDNGVVLGTPGNSRDVAIPSEWPKMRAVRYTIVGRTRTPVEQGFSQSLPQYADRAPCPFSSTGCPYTDGYLRRMVQGTVQLRNFGL